MINDYLYQQADFDIQNAMNNGTLETFIIDFNQYVWIQVTENLLEATSGSTLILTLGIAYTIRSCIQYRENTGEIECEEGCCRRTSVYNYVVDRWILDRVLPIVVFGEDYPNVSCGGFLGSTCFMQCESLEF